MIGYILSGGFGHCERFLAITEQFRKVSQEPMLVYADRLMKDFVDQEHQSIKYHWYLRQKKKKHVVARLLKQNRSDLFNCRYIINDIRKDVNSFRKKRTPGQMFFTLYHSDLSIRENDDFKNWKKHIIKIINNTSDLLFHVNFYPPSKITDLNASYFPIPIITRTVTESPEQVKKKLGLQPDEKFILVCLGSGVGKYAYNQIEQVYQVLNKMKLDYRILIMKGMRNHTINFNPKIITLELIKNGINIVNAADMVIAKPGMGIFQSCIATKKPLLFLPGDDSERKLKIFDLRKIIGKNAPVINEITPESLHKGIYLTLEQSYLFKNNFANVPSGGELIITQALQLLNNNQVKDPLEVFDFLKHINPYGDYVLLRRRKYA